MYAEYAEAQQNIFIEYVAFTTIMQFLVMNKNHFLLFCWTGPEKPGNITTAQGTDNLQINWTLPEGEVVRYIVNISNADLRYLNHTKTTLLTAHFTDLHPGRLYAVTVTAEAGSFSNTSDEHLFATGKNISK